MFGAFEESKKIHSVRSNSKIRIEDSTMRRRNVGQDYEDSDSDSDMMPPMISIPTKQDNCSNVDEEDAVYEYYYSEEEEDKGPLPAVAPPGWSDHPLLKAMQVQHRPSDWVMKMKNR